MTDSLVLNLDPPQSPILSSFSALLITEYLMIALTIETWHYLMIVAEFLSLAVYIASIAILDT